VCRRAQRSVVHVRIVVTASEPRGAMDQIERTITAGDVIEFTMHAAIVPMRAGSAEARDRHGPSGPTSTERSTGR
jgi:hypothetical protein